MKKAIIIMIIFFLAVVNENITNAQNFKPAKKHPIPSFNFKMTGQAFFEEDDDIISTREKRDLNVKVYTTSHLPMPWNMVTVYLIKNSGAQILGPYYLSLGETLTVAVSGKKWGAVVISDQEISVDVWFSKSSH
jgi:hypothetical protein